MPYPYPLAKKRSEALLEARKLHALTLLDKRVSWIENMGARVAGSHYREGKPDEEAILLSEELDAGLVIAGAASPDGSSGSSPKASPSASCAALTAPSWWWANRRHARKQRRTGYSLTTRTPRDRALLERRLFCICGGTRASSALLT